MSRRQAYAVVVAAAVLPRLAALLYERGAILASFVEKSDILARTYLRTGTFGYIPGEPSASTQPLYGWFLIAVYWVAGRHWWSLGTAQILVAALAAVLVYETGARFLSRRAGLIAALIATLHPYLVWHDVHANREILDQALGAALFLLALLAGARPSLRYTAALGVVSGLAILSNSRLTFLPIVLGAYLLWRRAGWTAAVAVPVLAAVTLAPWVIRNKVEVGCNTLTTDARALWKANNVHTFETLQHGKWIDDVPDLKRRQLTPQEAGGIYASTGRKIHVDECAAQRNYQHLVLRFWEHHPLEKLKLAAQATWMTWDPRVGLEEGRPNPGTLDTIRRWVEPLYMVPVFLLALWGLVLVSPAVRVLALTFLLYETAAAWIFAGQTRYRVPWDFVLALLAAAALDRVWSRLPFSQKR